VGLLAGAQAGRQHGAIRASSIGCAWKARRYVTKPQCGSSR